MLVRRPARRHQGVRGEKRRVLRHAGPGHRRSGHGWNRVSARQRQALRRRRRRRGIPRGARRTTPPACQHGGGPEPLEARGVALAPQPSGRQRRHRAWDYPRNDEWLGRAQGRPHRGAEGRPLHPHRRQIEPVGRVRTRSGSQSSGRALHRFDWKPVPLRRHGHAQPKRHPRLQRGGVRRCAA